MAVSERTPPAGLDMQGITSLANLFLGKDSTQSTSGTTQNTGGVTTNGSRTVSESVSPDAVNAIVNSILQGSQGLASVSSGQNKAGLYNSSTNRMLVNDLMARAAAEGAKLNKSQTTSVNETAADTRGTTTNNAQNTKVAAPISPKTAGTGLLGLQGLSVLSKTSAGQKILGKLGMGKTSAASGANTSAPSGTAAVDTATSQSGSSAPVTANVSQPVAVGQGTGFSAAMGEATEPVSNITDLGDTDLSFDQSADFMGFDYSGTEIAGAAGEVAGDAINGLDLGADYSFGDVGADIGGADFGVDPGSIDYTGDFSFDDFGPGDWGGDLFDFADGGLVTKDGNESLLKRKFVNVGAEKAFDSGGDEPVAAKSSNTSGSGNESGVDFFRKVPQKTAGNDPRAAEQKPNRSMAVRIIDKITGRDKTPGYATGGIVDITNMGLRAKGPDSQTSLGTSGQAEQAINSVLTRQNLNQQGSVAGQSGAVRSGGTGAVNTATANSGSRQPIRRREPGRIGEFSDAGSSGVGEGTTNGTVGTPSENAAAIGGLAATAVGLATGVPGLAVGLAMDAIGIPNSSMNPVSNAVSAVASMISNAVGMDAMSTAAATASANNPSPTQSDDNAAVANAIAVDENMDPMDALIGMLDESSTATGVSDNDGTSAEGGGIGGSGNSAGDGSGSDGSGDGGASASAATGGMIRGKGTSTSDSIKANLSDGEYVIRASVVQALGKDFFDQLNNSIAVK
jgi:hypothetical protein